VRVRLVGARPQILPVVFQVKRQGLVVRDTDTQIHAQEAKIDHPTFLKRIHDAGIGSYEVNIRNRQIRYKGETESYKEMILATGARPEKQALEPAAPPAQDPDKPAKPGKTNKAVKTMKRGKKWKRVKLHRVKKSRYRRSAAR
jgi:NADPH-dependent 2,4-dienoyl-CoA reductase/sulfur reductase-like enzyme